MSKRIPRVTNKLILKFWRSKMNTADIAKRLGMTEAEIVKILEIAKQDEKNRNKARKATISKSLMASVQNWRGVSVPRLRFMEETGGLGNCGSGEG